MFVDEHSSYVCLDLFGAPSCYQFNPGPMTYPEADTGCRSQGAFLLETETPEELDIVTDWVNGLYGNSLSTGT